MSRGMRLEDILRGRVDFAPCHERICLDIITRRSLTSVVMQSIVTHQDAARMSWPSDSRLVGLRRAPAGCCWHLDELPTWHWLPVRRLVSSQDWLDHRGVVRWAWIRRRTRRLLGSPSARMSLRTAFPGDWDWRAKACESLGNRDSDGGCVRVHLDRSRYSRHDRLPSGAALRSWHRQLDR